MKTVWHIFKKHPIAIAVYLLYGYFSQFIIVGKWRYTIALPHMHSGQRLTAGEGLMYGIIFLLFTATIFATITLIFALFNKDQKKFYLWLLLAIITPIAIWFLI